jgi:putative transposase
VKTIRLKVKPECYAWLCHASREVNFVWNWANETSQKAIRRFSGKPVWLSGFSLNNLSAGASECFEKIGAHTIQRVNGEFATKRRAAKAVRLRWRKSGGARRSLGWVPFRAANVKRHGNAVRFCGKTFRIFEAHRLDGVKFHDGCFAEDSCGDWWLCIPVEVEATDIPAPREVVGVDLGLKAVATTSDGEKLDAVRAYRDTEARIAQAQRRGHKRQAKRLHRKVKRQRADTLHKFTTGIVRKYQNIFIGDVSASWLTRSNAAKAAHDSGWAILTAQLQYKGQQAGRRVEVVNEAYTTQACSNCGSRTGPKGASMLVVRAWQCSACGTEHDRDVNAAKNIAMLGLRPQPPSAGTSGNKARRVGAAAARGGMNDVRC